MFDWDNLKQQRLLAIGSPKNVTKHDHHEPWAYIEYINAHERVCGAFFIGRRGKPMWHYSFKDAAAGAAKVLSSVESLRQSNESRAALKAQRNKPHSLQVDDVLVSSWGYEQTNVDWFKVARIVGPHMVELVKIGSQYLDDSMGFSDRGKCIPDSDRPIGEPFRKRADGNNHIRLSSYASAHKWDGRPHYWSSYA
jgi:hypothetical protein